MPKKIEVNFSTLVDLKAELFRKQEQANRQKQEKKNDKASSSSTFVKGGKPILYEARKAAAALEKQQKGAVSAEKRRRLEQLEASMREEERQLSRSRQRLEEKAKLYEKLKGGQADGNADSDGLYLVNFERKAFDERSDSEDESDHDNIPSAGGHIQDDEEDWVEYTDVLGRTRKCLRQDLPRFVAADQKLKDRRGDWSDESKPSTSVVPVNDRSELLSEDMRRELKRKAWEREEEEAAAATARGPVHYQHVAQGESRELGVGYFAFAPEEEARQQQMKTLDTLRQQTLSQRERSQKLKEKRQAALKARLDKVKERKNLKLEGIDSKSFLDESDEDEDPASNLEDIPLPQSSTARTQEADEFGSFPPPAPAKKQVRPWDVGKPKVPREDWADKRRKERHEEFAPPSFY